MQHIYFDRWPKAGLGVSSVERRVFPLLSPFFVAPALDQGQTNHYTSFGIAMSFRKTVLLEAVVRYAITFGVALALYAPISDGLHRAANSGKLEAIAVILGVVSLCSLTGYFGFSYTVVGKSPWFRFFGYLVGFGVTIPLILCWIVIYQVASIWIPELAWLWLTILLLLYLGILVFDLIDLMRMGLDLAATSFFEDGMGTN